MPGCCPAGIFPTLFPANTLRVAFATYVPACRFKVAGCYGPYSIPSSHPRNRLGMSTRYTVGHYHQTRIDRSLTVARLWPGPPFPFEGPPHRASFHPRKVVVLRPSRLASRLRAGKKGAFAYVTGPTLLSAAGFVTMSSRPAAHLEACTLYAGSHPPSLPPVWRRPGRNPTTANVTHGTLSTARALAPRCQLRSQSLLRRRLRISTSSSAQLHCTYGKW